MANSLTRRFWLVIATALTALALGWLAELLLSLFRGWPFGHSQYGHLAGWLGFSLILLTLYYSFKKRLGRKSGWSKLWFWLHQLSGVFATLIVFVHSGLHFHAVVPALALFSMVFVALSGLVGVFVHRKAIGLLGDARKELVKQGLSEDDVSAQLFELAGQEKTFRIWRRVHIPVAMVFGVLIVLHVGGALYFGGI